VPTLLAVPTSRLVALRALCTHGGLRSGGATVADLESAASFAGDLLTLQSET
jgi:hypothetical protein